MDDTSIRNGPQADGTGDSAVSRWWFRVATSLVLAYALIVVAVGLAQHHAADVRSMGEMDYCTTDFAISFNIFADYGLGLGASWIRNQIQASTSTVSQAQLRQWAGLAGLDEINVVAEDGRIVVSTDDEVAAVGKLSGASERFMVLTNGVTDSYSEPFRAGAANPDCCRKYLGVPFKDRPGFLQVGYDIRHSSDVFTAVMRGWTYGEKDTGFFFCARREGDDYRVVMDARADALARCPFDENGEIAPRAKAAHAVWTGKRLRADLHFDLDKILAAIPPTPDVNAALKNFTAKTMRLRFGGEECALRACHIGDMMVGTMLSLSANRSVNRTTTALVAVLLLVAFVAFGFLLLRMISSNRKLSAMREAENRRNAEDLTMAHSIQRTALPVIFPPYPRDLKMDVFARMDPARDVGGDFYDFYYVGDNRLALIVADVSGKGVPAAMFMMKAKTLLKSCVMSMSDLADAVAETNARLCEGNEAEMFVTCWVGVLDEDTGELSYVNAGHNAPYVRHQDGTLTPVDAVSGLFLGAMDGVVYKVNKTKLVPGDLLFLYTDGVTEANNVTHEMFGESRLEEVLRGECVCGMRHFNPQPGKLAPPQDVCQFVRSAVDAFAGSASQFDDITMLALRYRGRPEICGTEESATLESMPKISAFAEAKLEEFGCPHDAKSDMLVALDEILTNVCSYSGSPRVSLQIELARDPKAARFTVIDSGSPWNPLEHLDPDITLSADEREIGGLGILMVKKLMDDVSYRFEDGFNKFSFRKVFG
ncbi:MAG: SpoIIE family protein phosphatase [Kiritimatiellae bacterium]|nr:SpoIIE family protein phosphatase [Kiritimatiellia bacterium]